MEENKSAFDVYAVCSRQYIMGMNGPVDMNTMAISAEIERQGITDRRVFARVLNAGRHMIRKQRENRDDDA